MHKKLNKSGLLLSLFFLLCLTMASYAEEPQSADPYESFNRKVFAFNEFADKWFLKPIAKGYRWVAPDLVDDGVSNFFANLGEIKNLLNAAMQGDLRHTGVSTSRLLINTTAGIGGLFDVATELGLNERKEDFGQTLGNWGVDSGPYLVLPLLGSSSMRDAFSLIPDTAMSPIAYLDDEELRYGLFFLNLVDTRADLLTVESLISGDRYTFLREVYLQKRQSDIANGELSEDFDDFDDDF